MKTYEQTYNNNYIRYYYDWCIRSWTLVYLDNDGNQTGKAEYYYNKHQLKINYPLLTFKTTQNETNKKW